ncbi:unnamed protein product [Caretta caretta]
MENEHFTIHYDLSNLSHHRLNSTLYSIEIIFIQKVALQFSDFMQVHYTLGYYPTTVLIQIDAFAQMDYSLVNSPAFFRSYVDLDLKIVNTSVILTYLNRS